MTVDLDFAIEHFPLRLDSKYRLLIYTITRKEKWIFSHRIETHSHSAMLTLGFVVGTLFSKGVRRLCDSYFSGGDGDRLKIGRTSEPVPPPGQAQNASPTSKTASASHRDRAEHRPPTTTFFKNDCKHICKFPNMFNNCWMNATLHAALNLTVVQDELRHQSPERLIQL